MPRHTGPVRLLDTFIDGMYLNQINSESRLTYAFGPFSLVGSLVNAIVCGAIVGGAVMIGVQQSDAGFFIAAAVGLAPLSVFIRVYVRARRGDFIVDDGEPDESDHPGPQG